MKLFTILALAVAIGLATRRLAVRVLVARRAREGRRRRGVPRSAASAGQETSPLPDYAFPGVETSARRPASPASPARCSCSASATASSPGGPPQDGRRVSGALHRTGVAGDPTSPIHRLDPRAKLLGLAGITLVAVSTPLRAWPAFAACALALAAVAAVARIGPRTVWSRVRVDPPAGPVRRRLRAVRARRPGGRRPARSPLSEAGLATFARRQREGDDRHGQRRPARRDHELPGRPARARAPARAAAADPDRRLHVPLRVRDRRRGAADARPRSPRAATARDTLCRRPRSAGWRRRCSCAPTSAASACTWRCSRAATRAPCRASSVLAFGRADAVFLARAGARARAAARGGRGMSCAIHARGLRFRYPNGVAGPRRRRPATSPTASASRCSAPTAPARRR